MWWKFWSRVLELGGYAGIVEKLVWENESWFDEEVEFYGAKDEFQLLICHWFTVLQLFCFESVYKG